MSEPVLRNGCFSWSRAVSSPDGPPKSTTRHVLLALSLYMSPKGDSCFPSIDTLASDTGLSRKSVIAHLQEAAELGWVTKRPEPMKGKGKGWNRMHYVATAPTRKAVNLLHRLPEGGEPDGEGGEPDGTKAVNLLHPMYSDDASRDAPTGAGVLAESLIAVYPHPHDSAGVIEPPSPAAVNRELTSAMFRLGENVPGPAILAAARALAARYPRQSDRRYRPKLVTWLRDNGWESSVGVAESEAAEGYADRAAQTRDEMHRTLSGAAGEDVRRLADEFRASQPSPFDPSIPIPGETQ